MTLGIANKKYAGYYHHRWLVSIKRGTLFFRHKPHSIHTDWKLHLPKKILKTLSEEEKVNCLFWNEHFSYAEIIQISRDKVESYIKNLIMNEKIYPLWKYKMHDLFSKFILFIEKIKKHFYPRGYYHRFMNTKEYLSR